MKNSIDFSTGKYSFLTNPKYNMVSITIFIAIFLLISPLIPGVTWFRLGDFTLDVLNYYHTIMIPLAFLLIIYAAAAFELSRKYQLIINLSTYPILILTVIGLILFYPASTQTADYVIQGMRDFWMLILALVFGLGFILMPFKNKTKFKKIWGAYLLVLISVISAGIAAVMGMIYEYGDLFGFASIPIFNSYITSWGGLQTFLGNILTSHSHEMLPAVMGGIVGLVAIAFNYEKLSNLKRNIVNVSLLISFLGVITMTYLYLISSFGTYVIPAIFTSGPGGMNGLALDDSQTGIIGFGALLSIIGIYYILSSDKKKRLIQILELTTWIATMFVMIVIGYTMEFNETFYGFGNSGTPPNGGPGYMYDMAFTNAHLMFAFFIMPVLATILLVFWHFYQGVDISASITEKYVSLAGYISLTGMILGAFGVEIYLLTLSWAVEAIGISLIVISLILLGFIELKLLSKKLVKVNNTA